MRTYEYVKMLKLTVLRVWWRVIFPIHFPKTLIQIDIIKCIFCLYRNSVLSLLAYLCQTNIELTNQKKNPLCMDWYSFSLMS